MENASKALFIAAGVIIALMVLSLGVYLFVTFGQAAKNTHNQVEEAQLDQFNSQYTIYKEKANMTIYDVITVANMATRNNINNDLDSSNRDNTGSYYISVYLDEQKLRGTVSSKSNGPIESGKGVDINVLKRGYDEYIKKHTGVMMEKEYIKNNHREMPPIECHTVDISPSTRTSI